MMLARILPSRGESPFFVSLLTIAVAFALLPSGGAASRTWTGGSATSGNWSVTSNWSPAGPPQNGDDLSFPGGLAAADLLTTNNLTDLRLSSITFSGGSGGYAVRGNSLTLSNGVNAANTAGDNDINLEIILGANQTFTVISGGTLDVNGNIDLNGRNLTVNNSSTARLDGAISGTGQLTKTGAGVLALGGTSANTFSGTTTVNAGTLTLGKSAGVTSVPGALMIGNGSGADIVQLLTDNQIANTATVTIEDTAVFNLNNNDDTIGALVMNGGTIDTGAGLLTLGGNVTVNAASTLAEINGRLSLGSATRTFTIADGLAGDDMFITANVSGGLFAGIIKTGPGELRLRGTNTFSGITTVNEGILIAALSDTALGSGVGGTVVNGGALDIQLADFIGENLTLNKPATEGASVIIPAPTSWSGTITANTNALMIGGGPFTMSGEITGPGGLTLNGGTFLMTGTNANTFNDSLTLLAGTLVLRKTNVVAIPAPLVIGDGIGAASTAVVREERAFQIAAVPVTINSDGLLQLNGNDDTIGALTLNGGDVTTGTGTLSLGGTVTATSAGSAASISGNLSLGSVTRTFDVTDGSASPDLSINAVVSGTGDLTKTGNGEMALNAANTYTGLTTVRAGSLDVNNSLALGGLAGGTVVNNGASLLVRLDSQVGAEPLTIQGVGLFGFGALHGSFGSNSWAGTITLASNATVGVRSGDFLNLRGAITAAAAADLTKTGLGTLIMSGGAGTANSYDDTFVNEGTLVLAKTIFNVTIPGDLQIGDGTGGVAADVVLLQAAGSQIANTAEVNILGSGLLDLNGVFETTGSVEGSGRIDLGSGGTLDAGNDDDSSIFTGLIFGPGDVAKNGNGNWTLTGNNSYTGMTTINDDGWLIVNGSQPQSPVIITDDGDLFGRGVVGHITCFGGGVRPGVVFSAGILTCSNVMLTNMSLFDVDLNGNEPGTGYDQLNVRGTINLANVNLAVATGPGFIPAENERFTIITNDGVDAITGTFIGRPNNSLFGAGPFQLRIVYNGGSGNDVQLIVVSNALRLASYQVPTGGNGNAAFDPNECNLLFNVIFTNISTTPVTGVSATLVPQTGGVAVTQPYSAYPDVPVGGRGTNVTPFQVSMLPGFQCGTNVSFEVIVATAAHGTFRIPVVYSVINTGVEGPPVPFNNNTAMAIPDLGMVDSSVVVSGIDTPIRRVAVSLHITHTAAEDLDISLIGPDGTTVNLSSDNGGTASDYGTGCADAQRTVFDSASLAFPAIIGAAAPFVGTFRPEGSLFSFVGNIGTDVNGTWRLRIADDSGGAVGTLRCWSLFIAPTVCSDGGGACESCPERTIFGSISSSSQVQMGRLLFDSTESVCGTSEPCPGVSVAGLPRRHDAYTFVNGDSNGCVTVTLSGTCDLFSAAYVNSYNPNDVCQNYLADAGQRLGGLGGTNSYSFNVAPRSRFVVVVNQVNSDDFCDYRLGVSGGSCRPVLDIAPTTDNGVVLDWSTAAVGFSLERTDVLSSPPTPVWTPAGPAPVIIESRFTVTNNTAGSENFYRLRKP